MLHNGVIAYSFLGHVLLIVTGSRFTGMAYAHYFTTLLLPPPGTLVNRNTHEQTVSTTALS